MSTGAWRDRDRDRVLLDRVLETLKRSTLTRPERHPFVRSGRGEGGLSGRWRPVVRHASSDLRAGATAPSTARPYRR